MKVPLYQKIGVGLIAFGATYPMLSAILQPHYKHSSDRSDRTIIVTGATGNMGRAITSHLALRKARVIMACRDLEQCKSVRREIVMFTNHKGILCRHLDLEDIESINKFADEMIKNEPHIDVLINNAAVKNVEQKEMTKYGIEKNYFVNFIAPYLLTFRLLDKLTESSRITRDSRIINVIGNPKKDWNVDLTDINFDKRKYNSKTAYRQSKLALAYFTILLDQFLKRDDKLIFVFGTDPIYKSISESFVHPLNSWEEMLSIIKRYHSADPLRAVSTAVYCAIDSKPNGEISGNLFSYRMTYWGWGIADKDIYKAKAVWNDAAERLLKIKTDDDTKKDENSFISQSKNTKPEAGDTVK